MVRSKSNHRLSKWLWIALVNFFIAASIGMVLRFAFVTEIPGFKYSHFLNTHSHIAMLGWIFLLVYVLLLKSFLPEEYREKLFYKYIFWLLQFSVVGMVVSFPFQGYGPISIGFTTLNVVLSYVFIIYFWKDLNLTQSSRTHSVHLAKTALFFLGFSMLGVVMMGPILALQLKGTVVYYVAIHFYLHFQFNGWFIFSILAFLFKMAEEKEAYTSDSLFKRFYLLIVAATILTFALAIAWSNPGPLIFLSNSLGVLFQLSGMAIFIVLLSRFWRILENSIRLNLVSYLVKISIAGLVLKVLIQTAVVFPFVAEVAYTIRNYMIGFFHLLLLGVITLFGLGYAHLNGLFTLSSLKARSGVIIFLLGFFLSEILLFAQGTLFWLGMGFIPYYYELLFVVSILLPAGILIIIFSQAKHVFQVSTGLVSGNAA